jgi:hypothetical protein
MFLPVGYLYLLPERVPLVICKSQQHFNTFAGSFHEMYNRTIGYRRRGRPRLQFRDTIKRNLKLRDIKTDSWQSLSQQRAKWRAMVK